MSRLEDEKFVERLASPLTHLDDGRLSMDNFGKGPRGWKRADEKIHEEACRALYMSSIVDASEMEVRVSNGCVYLLGSVESREMKKAAERCVEIIPGVVDVQNELRIPRQNLS